MFSSSPLARALKRALDVAVSAVALILVSPMLAVFALLIRIESPGPAIFRQQRIGAGFRPFTIFKLRTMKLQGEPGAPLVTTSADARVTRVGRFLRRAKIDELPQLWNVLRGDMSLVGPRPEVPRYVEMFRADYAVILTVRPGVTDLASLTFRDEEQILAGTADPELHYRTHVLPAKIALAREYVRRASMGFDLAILVKTALEGFWLRCLPARSWVLRHTRPFVVALHLMLIVAASYAAFWLRFDGAIPEAERALWLRTLVWLMIVRVPILTLFRLFEGLWRYTSVYDLQNILAAVLGSELIFFVVVRGWLGELSYPRSVFILDALLLIFLMGSVRLAKRFYESSGHLRGSRRVLVVGSGDRADFVIRAMKSHVLGDYRPIGIVATSRESVGLRIHGVPVIGEVDNLKALARAAIVDEVVVAYDRSDADLDRRVVSALRVAGVPARDAFQLMASVVDHEVPPVASDGAAEAPARL